MDIAKLSMAMSSANIMNELSMRVMKMALDQTKDIEKLMSATDMSIPNLDPDIGRLLDISV